MPRSELAAVYAVGRLEEARHASPLAEAWEALARINATVRLSRLDGIGMDRGRIVRLTHDLPVDRGPGMESDGAALRIYADLASLGSPPPEVREVEDLLLPDASDREPAELCRHLHRWLLDGGRPSLGYMALCRCLVRIGLTDAPLSTLIRPVGAVWSSPSTWADKALDAIADGANAGRRDLTDLGLRVADWRRRLGKRRRNSRMEALLEYLAGSPVTTPTTLAGHLGISLRGASIMLSELAEHEIVVEVTGRGSWKAYAVAEGDALHVGSRRRSPGDALPSAPAADIHPLLSDADSVIARARDAIEKATKRGLGDYPAVGADVEDDAPSTRPPRST